MPGAHIIKKSSPSFNFFLNSSAIGDTSSKKNTAEDSTQFVPAVYLAVTLAKDLVSPSSSPSGSLHSNDLRLH
jgi:hypothetical protein